MSKLVVTFLMNFVRYKTSGRIPGCQDGVKMPDARCQVLGYQMPDISGPDISGPDISGPDARCPGRDRCNLPTPLLATQYSRELNI